jgi:putative hemin transport protein
MLDNAIAAERRDPNALKQAWAGYRAANPKLRIRDAAAALSVSEAELVATGVGENAIRLEPRWKELVDALPALGTVMALTRNDHAVHEKVGRYDQISVTEQGGVTLAPDIDLRLFFGHWHHGFAVTERIGGDGKGGDRHSLQIFDADGTAVHKVYLRPESDKAAFDALVAGFAAADQSPGVAVEPASKPARDRPDSEIDLAALEAGWRALEDTHDFFPLLRKLRVGRVQAFRLVADDLARRVGNGVFSQALELAADAQLPIMVFVGSPGVIQIHTGPVATVKRMGPWQNVLDPRFNLHLREDGIASAWLVRKPTRDSWVTSLELFDAAGRQIAWMFGKRKPGQAEDPAWPALAARAAGRGATNKGS